MENLKLIRMDYPEKDSIDEYIKFLEQYMQNCERLKDKISMPNKDVQLVGLEKELEDKLIEINSLIKCVLEKKDYTDLIFYQNNIKCEFTRRQQSLIDCYEDYLEEVNKDDDLDFHLPF